MPDLTHQQASLVAHTLHQIRPEWGIQSLMTILGNNRNVPSFGALILAATTKALDPTCKTPAPIFHPGDHWPETAKAHLPPPAPCQDHDTEPAHNCRSCLADVKVGDRPPTHIGKRWNADPTVGEPHPNHADPNRQ